MEIISKAEGERPLVLNGKKAEAVYGPPPEKLLASGSSSSSSASSSSSSSPKDASSSSPPSSFSDSSTAPSGAGINGLGVPGGGASIEADGTGVCDRSCYNTITPLTQNPSPGKLGGLNLGAEGAASFLGFSQQPSAERDAWRGSFVTAEGRNFKVGNSTWYFGGTNQYSLTQTGEREREREERRVFFRLFFFPVRKLFFLSLSKTLSLSHTHTTIPLTCETKTIKSKPTQTGGGTTRWRRR